MYHEFTQILGRAGLYDDDTPVLLAVSGGVDSMCMADLFRRTGLGFAVAHCNFRLRGDESDGDEALVRDWAVSAGIKFHREVFDTAGFARENSLSIEMAARELRYRWFADLCRAEGYGAVCVAHNANDNAETLLLNLVRGTGMRGLTGMSVESSVPCQDGGAPVKLLRPMLAFTRRQIEGYALARSVPYRNDSTNALTDYRRNRIRHLVIPVLEQMNPSFIKTVSDEMSYFGYAGALADSCSDRLLERITGYSDGCVTLDLEKLRSSGHWEYALYRFLDRYGFNRTAVTTLTGLLKSDRTLSGKRFHSPGYLLLTTGTRLMIRKVRPGGMAGTGLMPECDAFTVVRGPGRYTCNGISFSISLMDMDSLPTLKQPHGTLIFDASALPFPFVCRGWRDGDWFIPLGMKGRKKVSDFFTDLKYDRFRKESAVMVVDTCCAEDDGRIAAVLGERIDDRYRVNQETGTVLMIRKG